MSRYLALYVAAALIFFPLDFAWLATVGQGFYRDNMGALMRQSPNLAVAGAFYAVYLVGLVYFGIRPALSDGQWTTALLNGALFGFFCYATYDLTNLAVVQGYPGNVALVDIVWGTVLSAVAAAGGFLLARAVVGLPGPA